MAQTIHELHYQIEEADARLRMASATLSQMYGRAKVMRKEKASLKKITKQAVESFCKYREEHTVLLIKLGEFDAAQEALK